MLVILNREAYPVCLVKLKPKCVHVGYNDGEQG